MMISFQLTIITFLLLAIQGTFAVKTSRLGIREGNDQERNASVPRKLHWGKSHKSHKSSKKSYGPKKKKLVADLKTGGRNSDTIGEVVVNFTNNEMKSISYDIDDMPKVCEKCYIAIHEGNCKDPDDEYWKGGGSWSYSKSSKWDEEGIITSSQDGSAAGTIFGIDNGYKFNKNKGNAIILYDDDGDEIACGKLK